MKREDERPVETCRWHVSHADTAPPQSAPLQSVYSPRPYLSHRAGGMLFLPILPAPIKSLESSIFTERMNNVEEMRACCLSFPHVNEKVQWEDHLLFRVADKMFAIYNLNPASTNILSFKCTPENFADLTEKEGIIPAPYMARNNWVALQPGHPLSGKQLEKYLRESYEMIYAKLPRKIKVELEGGMAGDQKEGSTKGSTKRQKREG